MHYELTGIFNDEFTYLLCEHLDGLAGDIGTEETVELVKTFKAYKCTREEEPVFRIKDLPHLNVIIVDVMQT